MIVAWLWCFEIAEIAKTYGCEFTLDFRDGSRADIPRI